MTKKQKFKAGDIVVVNDQINIYSVKTFLTTNVVLPDVHFASDTKSEVIDKLCAERKFGFIETEPYKSTYSIPINSTGVVMSYDSMYGANSGSRYIILGNEPFPLRYGPQEQIKHSKGSYFYIRSRCKYPVVLFGDKLVCLSKTGARKLIIMDQAEKKLNTTVRISYDVDLNEVYKSNIISSLIEKLSIFQKNTKSFLISKKNAKNVSILNVTCHNFDGSVDELEGEALKKILENAVKND